MAFHVRFVDWLQVERRQAPPTEKARNNSTLKRLAVELAVLFVFGTARRQVECLTKLQKIKFEIKTKKRRRNFRRIFIARGN